jgi:8-oxo-dGTP diphosphatase
MEISRIEIDQQYGNRLRIRATGFCIENNKILLVKHHNLGKLNYLWSFPGGGLQFGEDIKVAIQREFLEEVGFEVKVKNLLFVHQYLELPLHSIEICFAVEKIKGELKKGFDPELPLEKQMIKEVKFFSIDEIQQIPPEALHHRLKSLKSLEEITNYVDFF